jgi:hypothetical protein
VYALDHIRSSKTVCECLWVLLIGLWALVDFAWAHASHGIVIFTND